MSQSRRQRRAAQRAGRPAAAHTSAGSAFPHEALGISLALLIGVAIAYWPVHTLGFVRFDDPLYVTQNPRVWDGLTWSSMKWALTSSYAANWHPVTWISHMLDVQLFGLNPMGHHIVNVLLHAVTMLLLFVVLFRMTGAIGRSAAVAGLFGLHPIHVESVAWVAERKDVLSALFWVLTMWTYVAYVRQPRVSRYIWIVVTFALGLMAKPMVVTLPFALLLLDVWPLRRIDLHAGWWTAARSLLLEKAPLFALSIGSSVITFVVQRHGGTVASSVRLPLVERIGNALISYIAYIGKTLWPLHLAAYYPYPRVLPVALVVVSAVLLLAISIAAIFAGRRHPYVLIGWLWYLGTLVPAIGIVQVGTQAMADRYTYIPLIGIFIILAWGVPDILSSPRWKTPIAAVTAAMLLSCAVVARQQVHHWESSQTLWQHALSVTTDNYAAHTFYGNALATQGNVDGAVAEYNEALRIRPDYPEAHNNLGPALAQSGRVDEAIAHFLEAVRLRPNYADAHNNLGVALATQGKFDEAIAHYTEALRLDPDQSRPHSNLGLALQAQGRTAEATREFELALRMNRNDVDAQNGLKALQGQRP